jgi:hypothetical protein
MVGLTTRPVNCLFLKKEQFLDQLRDEGTSCTTEVVAILKVCEGNMATARNVTTPHIYTVLHI